MEASGLLHPRVPRHEDAALAGKSPKAQADTESIGYVLDGLGRNDKDCVATVQFEMRCSGRQIMTSIVGEN
jgi:hypothetical protein